MPDGWLTSSSESSWRYVARVVGRRPSSVMMVGWGWWDPILTSTGACWLGWRRVGGRRVVVGMGGVGGVWPGWLDQYGSGGQGWSAWVGWGGVWPGWLDQYGSGGQGWSAWVGWGGVWPGWLDQYGSGGQGGGGWRGRPFGGELQHGKLASRATAGVRCRNPQIAGKAENVAWRKILRRRGRGWVGPPGLTSTDLGGELGVSCFVDVSRGMKTLPAAWLSGVKSRNRQIAGKAENMARRKIFARRGRGWVGPRLDQYKSAGQGGELGVSCFVDVSQGMKTLPAAWLSG
ncbi:hypothetical protein U1Q18_051641 [Sarracenia purpurea var. burkii]